MLFHAFGSSDPLAEIEDFPQAKYLRCYLKDLTAQVVLEEPAYFDRDYLDEYAAYYSTVAESKGNVCKRLHFFDRPVDAELLNRALAGPGVERTAVEDAYLGFAVIRPLKQAPLGRTVIKWYPDDPRRYNGNPRIVSPSREYRVHVAGLPLRVVGLAWQQQDGAVALCATTALWSLLHSSAFDDHHAIPTTAEVTRFAYESLRRGAHVFPASDGLDIRQIVEAIARARLTPFLLEGDWSRDQRGFRREKFSTACAVMIRSGYPVLISGQLEEKGGHVICATGFREVGPPNSPGQVELQDTNIETLYAHDDNLGPNVRFRISESKGKATKGRIMLKPEPPPKRYSGPRLPDPAEDYPAFVPEHLIVGVHEGLHVTPDELHRIAMIIGANLRPRLTGQIKFPVTITARFVRIATYLESVLSTPFGGHGATSEVLGRLRLRLSTELPPMSLHVGVIRVGYGPAPVADVLIDTSDRPRLDQASPIVPRWNAFGTVLFEPSFAPVFEALRDVIPFGEIIAAA